MFPFSRPFSRIGHRNGVGSQSFVLFSRTGSGRGVAPRNIKGNPRSWKNRWIRLSRTGGCTVSYDRGGKGGQGRNPRKNTHRRYRRGIVRREATFFVESNSTLAARCTAYLREFLLDVRVDVPVESFERNSSNFKAVEKFAARRGSDRYVPSASPTPQRSRESNPWKLGFLASERLERTHERREGVGKKKKKFSREAQTGLL